MRIVLAIGFACALVQQADAGVGRISAAIGFAGGDDPTVNGLVALDAGWNVDPEVLVGVHIAAAPIAEEIDVDIRSMFDRVYYYKILPVQVGAMAQFRIGERGWIEPWLGVQYGFEISNCETFYDKRVPGGSTTYTCGNSSYYEGHLQPAGGVAFGKGIWAQGRVSLLGAISLAMGGESRFVGLWAGAGFTL